VTPRRAVYFLIALQLVLLAATGYLVRSLSDVRADNFQQVRDLQIGCERANRVRATTHYLVRERIEDAKVVGAEASSSAIRRRFVEQITRGSAELERLNLDRSESPQDNKPWLVACERAFPNR
jgi:hypothetical protein